MVDSKQNALGTRKCFLLHFQVAQECLKQLRLTSDDDHAAPDEEKLSALFDVIRVSRCFGNTLEGTPSFEVELLLFFF